MLKSYEAIYENGQIKWLAEQPDVSSARVVVTVLEETNNVAGNGVSRLPAKKRTFPADMAGKIKFLDDEVTQPVKRRFPPASIAGKGKTFKSLIDFQRIGEMRLIRLSRYVYRQYLVTKLRWQIAKGDWTYLALQMSGFKQR